MKLSVDMHIHSVLSPCGDIDMTPNNIINMAYIKNLDVISITDHNTMLNVDAAIKIAEKRGIIVVPGIEVTTREEVHVLCYFESLEYGMGFQKIIYEGLPNIKNKEEIFGEQLILDDNDKLKGTLDKLLINSTKYTIDQVYELVKKFNGVMIPAHIDKKSYSILSVLGFIPENLKIETVEITKKCDLFTLKNFIN